MTTFNQASMVVLTTRFKASEQNHEGNVKKAFGEVVNLTNDVKLVAADGEPLETNRFVLSVFSPCLQKLLLLETGESTVLHLPDCSSKSLKHLLGLFREGISEMNVSEIGDINDLIDSAKLLNVDIRNFSFIHQNSLEDGTDISKTETKSAESLLESNTDGKRMGRLSFETNPTTLKKPRIDEKEDSIKKFNQNFKKYPSEDSGFKSLPDIDAYKSNSSHLVLPAKNLGNPLNLLPTFAHSPKVSPMDSKAAICSKKAGKDSSFCNVHKKIHSGKKGSSSQPRPSDKVRRKLLITKDATKEWKCDVCDISFSIREKLRDHRREVKCKQRVVCKNKQRSVDLPTLQDKGTIPFPEDLISLPGRSNFLPSLEQNSLVQNSNFSPSLDQSSYISSENGSVSFPSNFELVQDVKEETLPYIDKSLKFSSLMQNSLVSNEEDSNEERQSKGGTGQIPSSEPRIPRRMALSQLVSKEIPLTDKEIMSPFEAKFNTSPIRKQLMMKCCPTNSTLKRCCLKLDKSPQLKKRTGKSLSQTNG